MYDQPGTGAVFLAPSPARTRLCFFVTGVDDVGLLKASWMVPFRTGVLAADYTVVGEDYGGPDAGWTVGGTGRVLATGYWSNEWEYEPGAGYLK